MKSRDTLVRLKRFQVEEKRRRLTQIEMMIAEFNRMSAELDREIAAEEQKTGVKDISHYAYSTYARAARARRDNLVHSADELKGQLDEARRQLDQANDDLAKAQSLAFAAGLASLILFAMASRPQWPRLRDLALTLVAAGGMAALAAPLRSLEPGLPLMLTQIVLAGSFYLLIVAVFDLAGLRRAFLVKAAPAARWLHGRHDIFKTLLPLSIE